uniref:dnaJ homolog subfamily C member 10 isoform X1 n=1 Tax=Ciona intestinalis TaxID=7719 RepID=UPI000EF45DF0|nr:dnaJ homolog subfamily C member 10 isoform X1 [Ciona intestinalis]|eukprot:XP_026691925.1 dnaJ homolog subfamily C member 10 isoform X1 [Ciona intestinalis]
MKLPKLNLVCFVFILQLTYCFGEDYYEVLGVSKDASLKQIRKAFKKLALTMHPDKNVNDPEAHNKFIKINGIYEVLKDEDLRKKYDQFGEEGLKENGRGGGRYESYNYYRDEFGIYDDDPDVVTLDGSDFDAAVKSGETWFVNFYSPRCSHCHDLAPTWREFAKEMTGVVNIAALECSGMNLIFCLKQKIRSFPNLRFFRPQTEPIKYMGDRSKKDLMKFVLEHVNIDVVDLWDGNIAEEISSHPKLPWVVSFCGGDAEAHEDEDGEIIGDCPSRNTRMKMAGLLKDIANVGSIDCGTSPELCKRANASKKAGVYYFPLDTFPEPKKNDRIHSFSSLDAREIYSEFMLQLMPSLTKVTVTKLEKLVSRQATLAFFQFDTTNDVDVKETNLKKLPQLLKDHNIDVVKVYCNNTRWCFDNFHISQDAVLVFKGTGIEEYEIHHGKLTTAELSLFAHESVHARVATLNAQHFHENSLKESNQPWFVDFFAPWCPPCRALLPELRKASTSLLNIKFGTVDCTSFSSICEKFKIHSYPTTMLFNQSVVTEYNGQHNSHGILEFVQDLISPPYEHLNPESFKDKVLRRGVGVTWIVDFYAKWCGPCKAMLPAWRQMAKLLEGVVKVGAVDCAIPTNNQLCKTQGVNAYPEIRLFPSKKKPRSNPLYKVYTDWNRQALAMAGWAIESTNHDVKDMTMEDFDRGQLIDKQAWLLDFYAPWCGPCMAFSPKFILTSFRFVGRVKFGKVNCQQFPSICSQAGVNAYPSVKFYHPVKSDEKRSSVKSITSQDPDEITQLVEQFIQPYKHLIKKKSSQKKKDEL